MNRGAETKFSLSLLLLSMSDGASGQQSNRLIVLLSVGFFVTEVAARFGSKDIGLARSDMNDAARKRCSRSTTPRIMSKTACLFCFAIFELGWMWWWELELRVIPSSKFPSPSSLSHFRCVANSKPFWRLLGVRKLSVTEWFERLKLY